MALFLMIRLIIVLHLAYEYAKRGACLAIVARRENLLQEVAEKARKLGYPDVFPICADVLKVDDCKRFVEEAVNHFGRLDHVVNNAGIGSMCLIGDATDVTKFETVMDVNFWGSIYPTYFAIPHLKRTKGSIFVNASSTAILSLPGLSIYSASKAALVSFYETKRVELAPEISITIATLGFVESEMSKGKYLNGEGTTEVNSDLANAFLNQLPVMSSSACAKSIVDAVCRKESYVTEPKWYNPRVRERRSVPFEQSETALAKNRLILLMVMVKRWSTWKDLIHKFEVVMMQCSELLLNQNICLLSWQGNPCLKVFLMFGASLDIRLTAMLVLCLVSHMLISQLCAESFCLGREIRV